MTQRALAPENLSPESRRLWRAISEGYELSDEGRELLQLACRAKDRAAEARALLRKDGLVVRTKGGGARAHPAAKIATEAEAVFMKALKALRLE